jgi:hypothetical protein
LVASSPAGVSIPMLTQGCWAFAIFLLGMLFATYLGQNGMRCTIEPAMLRLRFPRAMTMSYLVKGALFAFPALVLVLVDGRTVFFATAVAWLIAIGALQAARSRIAISPGDVQRLEFDDKAPSFLRIETAAGTIVEIGVDNFGAFLKSMACVGKFPNIVGSKN